jgi:transglutaminase-like putative cysteine protease/pimeloyl-ACP methyl ester carboxylesterase
MTCEGGTATTRVMFVELCAVMILASPLWGQASPARPAELPAKLQRALDEVPAAHRQSLAELVAAMPEADRDRLDVEFLLADVALAESVYARVAWRDQVPRDLFEGYVLPYVQGTEERDPWRQKFVTELLPTVEGLRTPGEVALRLNATIFERYQVRYSTSRKRADQSPSESIEQGVASCTGLSILLADACRACCVPARLVSVKWPHKAGNHTWVEVWDGTAWRFVGAAEPDPAGFDRAWFVGDAAQCADADREHRIWAVSYQPTGERMPVGWSERGELWGVDVTQRYAASTPTGPDPLLVQLRRWFRSSEQDREQMEFDLNLDAELRSKSGDGRLRGLAFQAFCEEEAVRCRADHEARVVRAGGKQSPFVVKSVGEKPVKGWGLVIAMHGGGGVPKQVNDDQWRIMQRYYRDHPEARGYLYCALRAPTDDWNGFYTGYFYPVLEQLIRQFVVCDGVDPDRVVAIGYSHGGYGAFAVGPKLPHRFAAVHSSAAAPTDGQSLPDGLHSLRFSWMVGGRDTAYGRRERCEAFAAQVAALQKSHPGRYPCSFTLVEDCGHGGLPDRDLLATLLTHERQPLPSEVRWRPSDQTVRDHYWLRVTEPAVSQQVVAAIAGQQLVLQLEGVDAIEVWLDARLVGMDGDLEVVLGNRTRRFTPEPSLGTLCRTMAQRGDPRLAASWVLRLED